MYVFRRFSSSKALRTASSRLLSLSLAGPVEAGPGFRSMMAVRIRIGNHETRRPIARSCAVALAPTSPKAFSSVTSRAKRKGKKETKTGTTPRLR
jgi:hypothetical protein